MRHSYAFSLYHHLVLETDVNVAHNFATSLFSAPQSYDLHRIIFQVDFWKAAHFYMYFRK